MNAAVPRNAMGESSAIRGDEVESRNVDPNDRPLLLFQPVR